MTTYELLEMVSLDALGLLDDDEREAFEAAFRAAPPSVQAQVRREQARVARSDALLPDLEPPPGLRARVLAAVREAMEAVALRRSGAGRAGGRAAGWLALRPSRSVSPVWRAAAIGCAAAAIVFAVTTLNMRSQFDEVTDGIVKNRVTDQMVKEWGPRFQSLLFNPGTRFVQFSTVTGEAQGPAAPAANAAAGGSAVGALLVLDSDKSDGQLMLQGLPPSAEGPYTLNVVDAKGNVVGDAVVTFRATDSYKRIKGLKLAPGQSLAIMAPGAGAADRPAVVLRSVKG